MLHIVKPGNENFINMELFNTKDLQHIGAALLKKKETIAVAESVTAGSLQFALSGIPDASLFFQGGVTAYNVGQKTKLLGVEPLHALSVNCVSKKVTTEMALGIAKLYSSEWAIGITGYASPVPESDNKVFAFYTIVYKNKVKASGKINPSMAEPQVLQTGYVNFVLKKLASII
jgi:nicotinamide-nucleotide amidase